MSAATSGVLFDIDGTLCDTNYLHTIAWARAFDELGYRVPMASIHHAIGMGSDKLLPSLIRKEDGAADDRHGFHYERLHGEVRAFDGAADLLREVKRRGAKVVLATSAKERDLEVLTKAIGADDAVDHITTSGDVDRTKPDPDIFGAAIEAAGLDRSRTVVVGDTVWDVEAARRLGLDAVCVLTGGISCEKLDAAGAAAVYDDVADLLDCLDEGPLGRLLS